jgi:hypothetical protein
MEGRSLFSRSLSLFAKAFVQNDQFGEILIQFLAEGFEARCMSLRFLARPKAGIGRTLAETDHLLHISVQEIAFCPQVVFHRRHSSIGASAFHSYWFLSCRGVSFLLTCTLADDLLPRLASRQSPTGGTSNKRSWARA